MVKSSAGDREPSDPDAALTARFDPSLSGPPCVWEVLAGAALTITLVGGWVFGVGLGLLICLGAALGLLALGVLWAVRVAATFGPLLRAHRGARSGRAGWVRWLLVPILVVHAFAVVWADWQFRLRFHLSRTQLDGAAARIRSGSNTEGRWIGVQRIESAYLEGAVVVFHVNSGKGSDSGYAQSPQPLPASDGRYVFIPVTDDWYWYVHR